MKILHVTPSCFPATYFGGPIFTVYEMNNALSRISGVSLKTLTTDTAGPGLAQRLDATKIAALYPGQEVVMTPRVAGDSVSLAMLWKLPALVRWADVVHLTAIYSFPTIPVLLACRLLGKPVVWSPHGAVQDAHEWNGSRRRGAKRLWEIFCNMLLVRGRAVMHVISGREQGATQARIGKATAIIVPNGVDVPVALPPRTSRPEGRLRLMYLGRLSPKKGVENLLHAMAMLGDADIELVIYGAGDEGYASTLKSLAGQLGVLDRTVSFAGQVDSGERELAFSRADACIVPSYTECFCMVVAEALARGMPVIASRGTPWEGVEARGCGLWVDNSPEELVRAIEQLRGMDLADMGARGREWMRQEFSWDGVAADMMGIYHSLVAGKAKE